MPSTESHAVQTRLPYLARDELYSHEKPFGADFPVDKFEGAQLANHVFDDRLVVVNDVRAILPPSIEQNGFCFIKADTSLKAADATNERTSAVQSYLLEIQRLLYDHFPEYSRIEVMDFQVKSPNM